CARMGPPARLSLQEAVASQPVAGGTSHHADGDSAGVCPAFSRLCQPRILTTASEESPRIALVHERFTEIAGSEHVIEQFSVQWPQAPIYAALSRPAGIPAG